MLSDCRNGTVRARAASTCRGTVSCGPTTGERTGITASPNVRLLQSGTRVQKLDLRPAAGTPLLAPTARLDSRQSLAECLIVPSLSTCAHFFVWPASIYLCRTLLHNVPHPAFLRNHRDESSCDRPESRLPRQPFQAHQFEGSSGGAATRFDTRAIFGYNL